MTNPTWPGSLPQKVTAGGYKETFIDNTIRSQMAVGMKTRLRDTKEIRTFQVQIRLSLAQKATLRQFWRDTLSFGSLKFDWVEFDDGTTAATYRMMGPPQIEAISGTLFRATLSLRTAD